MAADVLTDGKDQFVINQSHVQQVQMVDNVKIVVNQQAHMVTAVVPVFNTSVVNTVKLMTDYAILDMEEMNV